MIIKLLFIAALASSAISRYVPRYADLDEEDQMLLRAAYDAPYEQEEYHEEEEAPGKLDLLKGGMWALKTKIKELKTFDKALVAHLLATKLQIKELLATLKVEKKKPVYHYQSPSPPSYHQYEPPHYTAPAPPEQYSQHASPQYGPPQHAPSKYDPPAPIQYPPVQYEVHAAPASPEQYSQHAPPQYAPQNAPPKYDSPAPVQYSPPSAAPPSAQQYSHDPYYGY